MFFFNFSILGIENSGRNWTYAQDTFCVRKGETSFNLPVMKKP